MARTQSDGQEQRDYRSYLLRLWRASPGGPWRAALQSTATGETRAFGTVGDLVAFIVGGLTEGEDDPPGPPAVQSGIRTEEVQ